MEVSVSSPAFSQVFEQVVHLRFRASDGWRALRPGHAPARALLVEGVLVLRELAGGLVWIVCDAGLVRIERAAVRVLTRWAIVANTLADLREHVEALELERARVEAETRTLVQHHDIATQRALAALDRRGGR